jgi:hypothetical protein
MKQVIEIKILNDYHLWLKFSDDTEKVINFRPFLGKGFIKELLDDENFKKVDIEPGGGIAWYNGYDFCPEYLKQLESSGEKDVA